MNHCLVIHSESKEVLFKTDIDNIDQAYSFMNDMVEMGLEVELIVPSTAQTLAHSLGASPEEQEKLKQELHDEIDSHNEEDSCCYSNYLK